jgi:hypothetical protein
MSDKGMASIQFSSTQPVQPDFSGGHRKSAETGRESEQESPVALSAANSTSADAATAWRVRRNGPPLPFSKRTAGSLYRFDKE